MSENKTEPETREPAKAMGYEERAEECVRLANLTTDKMICTELLKLRQTYLATAARLKAIYFDSLNR